MTIQIKHAKTNNIPDWTQAELNTQIAAGNFPAGTVLNDITLPSDWNNALVVNGTTDKGILYTNGGTLKQDTSSFVYNETARRLTVGDGSETVQFLLTDQTKLLVNGNVTTINELVIIGNSTVFDFTPSANTNSGSYGLCIYVADGITARTKGNKNFNGGIPFVQASSNSFSLFGSFGQTNIDHSGTIDGAIGSLYASNHNGYGATADLLVGGVFNVTCADDAGLGSPTGSLSRAVGGWFSVCIDNGVSIATAASGKFVEPFVNAGAGTITNKTAAEIRGTYSIQWSDIASAASITNMAVATSKIRLTGSTATTIHGIHADSFEKEVIIYNPTGATLTIKNQSGTEGTAANRIITATAADVSVLSGQSIRLSWNSTYSRWVHLSYV